MKPKTKPVEDPNKVWVDCWQCGGHGSIGGCFEDCCSCMGDPDDPDTCCSPRKCDICRGEGRYQVPADSDAARAEFGD
jgi:hypothetical protein